MYFVINMSEKWLFSPLYSEFHPIFDKKWNIFNFRSICWLFTIRILVIEENFRWFFLNHQNITTQRKYYGYCVLMYVVNQIRKSVYRPFRAAHVQSPATLLWLSSQGKRRLPFRVCPLFLSGRVCRPVAARSCIAFRHRWCRRSLSRLSIILVSPFVEKEQFDTKRYSNSY